ncbi:hypothetical protein VTK56DRAFT_6482 [Thermocarpiscus australiensis]
MSFDHDPGDLLGREDHAGEPEILRLYTPRNEIKIMVRILAILGEDCLLATLGCKRKPLISSLPIFPSSLLPMLASSGGSSADLPHVDILSSGQSRAVSAVRRVVR